MIFKSLKTVSASQSPIGTNKPLEDSEDFEDFEESQSPIGTNKTIF